MFFYVFCNNNLNFNYIMDEEPKWGLHIIKIKKSVGLEEANKIARELLKLKKDKYCRKTGNYFIFRNVSKPKFIPKTFKSKKINDTTTLTFGQLKPEFHHLEGGGFFDYFKKAANTVKEVVQKGIKSVSNAFKPRLDGYNNGTTKTLEQYGNDQIASLTVYRTPILKVLNTALDFITKNKWSELKKKYGYDQLYHLQLVANVKTNDGQNKNVVIEKNEVINVSTNVDSNDKTQTIPVNFTPPLTINELLNKTRTKLGDKEFFSYSAFGNNNCQNFIKSLLETSNIYNTSINSFVFQDLSELTKELPSFLPKLADKLTDTAAVVNKLTGRGEEGEEHDLMIQKLDEILELLKKSKNKKVTGGKMKIRYNDDSDIEELFK